MRRMSLFTIVCAALLLTLASVAQAQDTPDHQPNAEEAAALNCSDFATQRGAQALLETSDPFELDKDGDGKACESGQDKVAEDGTELGAKTAGDLDCIDFSSQKAAQAHLRANPSDGNNLDIADNGIACEIVPVPYDDSASDKKPVIQARSSSDLNCDDFEYQQEAQMVYFRNEDDPNKLDDNGNGLACEEQLPALVSNQTSVRAAEVQVGTEGFSPWPPVVGGLLAGFGVLGFAAWKRSRA